jgi:hypothetical protein
VIKIEYIISTLTTIEGTEKDYLRVLKKLEKIESDKSVVGNAIDVI